MIKDKKRDSSFRRQRERLTGTLANLHSTRPQSAAGVRITRLTKGFHSNTKVELYPIIFYKRSVFIRQITSLSRSSFSVLSVRGDHAINIFSEYYVYAPPPLR
jgi:hypothetical protein